MKIRYTVSMSGADSTFPAFEKDNKGEWVYYDVSDLEGVNLVDAEYAVPKVKKEYEDAKKNVDTLKAEKAAKEKLEKDAAELDGLKEREAKLKEELKDLSGRIKAVEAAIKGN